MKIYSHSRMLIAWLQNQIGGAKQNPQNEDNNCTNVVPKGSLQPTIKVNRLGGKILTGKHRKKRTKRKKDTKNNKTQIYYKHYILEINK